MPGYLHHVQWSVADVEQFSAKLRLQYGMRVVADREGEVVLQCGSVVFLISQTRSSVIEEALAEGYPRLSGRSGGESVFNLCLEVGDVNDCYERMIELGSLSISAPRDLTTGEGEVSLAVVSSPCHNVIHSLVNTDRYRGLFLPGFTAVEESHEGGEAGEGGDLLTHVDHGKGSLLPLDDTQYFFSDLRLRHR